MVFLDFPFIFTENNNKKCMSISIKIKEDLQNLFIYLIEYYTFM